MKLSNLLLVLTVSSMVFHPLDASSLNQYEKTISKFDQKITLFERISRDGLLSFDLIISLLEDIENDDLDEEIDSHELNEFVVFLTRLGFCGDVEKEFLLENDIKDLLEEEHYSIVFDSSHEIVLCGGKIKKAWKKTKKYVKEHKKEILIGTGIAVGVVVLGIGIAAAIGAGTGAAVASSDSSPKEHSKKHVNPAEVEALPGSTFTFSTMQEPSFSNEIIQGHITNFKEIITEEVQIGSSENGQDSSFIEKARDIGSYLAHQALEGASEIVSFVPELFDEVKEVGSRFISSHENTMDSKSHHIDNLEKAITRGHQIIDEAFSTDQAKHFTQEANETGWDNDFDIGILPPPGNFSKDLNTSKFNEPIKNLGQETAFLAEELGLAPREIAHHRDINFTEHALKRAAERGVSQEAIFDALRGPLKVEEIKIDHLGRPSQRFVGKNAEVVLNPKTGQVVSVNPTSTKKAEKLMKKEANVEN